MDLGGLRSSGGNLDVGVYSTASMSHVEFRVEGRFRGAPVTLQGVGPGNRMCRAGTTYCVLGSPRRPGQPELPHRRGSDQALRPTGPMTGILASRDAWKDRR